jgi:hypothetical protein
MIRAFGAYIRERNNYWKILFWDEIVPSAAKADLSSKQLCTA